MLLIFPNPLGIFGCRLKENVLVLVSLSLLSYDDCKILTLLDQPPPASIMALPSESATSVGAAGMNLAVMTVTEVEVAMVGDLATTTAVADRATVDQWLPQCEVMIEGIGDTTTVLLVLMKEARTTEIVPPEVTTIEGDLLRTTAVTMAEERETTMIDLDGMPASLGAIKRRLSLFFSFVLYFLWSSRACTITINKNSKPWTIYRW